jgi:hypothetical protein
MCVIGNLIWNLHEFLSLTLWTFLVGMKDAAAAIVSVNVLTIVHLLYEARVNVNLIH